MANKFKCGDIVTYKHSLYYTRDQIAIIISLQDKCIDDIDVTYKVLWLNKDKFYATIKYELSINYV